MIGGIHEGDKTHGGRSEEENNAGRKKQNGEFVVLSTIKTRTEKTLKLNKEMIDYYIESVVSPESAMGERFEGAELAYGSETRTKQGASRAQRQHRAPQKKAGTDRI